MRTLQDAKSDKFQGKKRSLLNPCLEKYSACIAASITHQAEATLLTIFMVLTRHYHHNQQYAVYGKDFCETILNEFEILNKAINDNHFCETILNDK